jgi:GNAT superfamily N-acetyltransferase
MKIELCKKKDLKQCEDLCRAPELLGPGNESFTVDYLRLFLKSKYFLVAKKKEKITGLIIGEKLKGGGVMIWAIVVDKEYRGKKIGGRLLREFEGNAKKDKCSWLILYATTKKQKISRFL